MNLHSFPKLAASSLALAAALAVPAAGQANSMSLLAAPQQQERPAASGNNLYCAGFVQNSPIDTSRKIVGAVDEQDGFVYAENDLMYINVGSNKGVQVGDIMSVVRPRGQVHSKWSRKDNLGFFAQEVGAVVVVRVKPEVSAVRVKTSCENLLIGDLVQASQVRVAPVVSQRPPLDLFADPSGKAKGRVILTRESTDLITRDSIVYVDLGAEDNVRVGDSLTVYRPLGEGNLFHFPQEESVQARSEGFESFKYHGGKFSNQAGRKSGDQARGHVVTTKQAKEDRPGDIRKVVGEMVILNVKERTATAVVTRTAQEIHPGDWVEVQ